ncbi:MAG: hypothetical protein U9Q33_00705 [Campylobacterota bacterium]|nr:hypothetical protein [Campylobacterota bacterium]
MNEENINNLIALFKCECYENFYFDETTPSINIRRIDNSKDSNIFTELDSITNALITYSIDFSVDKDGTIILS